MVERADDGSVEGGEATKRVLSAMDIEDIEKLQPPPSPQEEMLQKMQMMSASLELRMQGAKLDREMSETLKNIAQAEAEEEGPDDMQRYMEVLKAMKQELDNESSRLGILDKGSGNSQNTGSDGTVSPKS